MIGVEMDELLNHIRRIAQEVVGRQQTKATLVCTGYNPKIHAVKGIIQPAGNESGWIPLAAIHVGNGHGILIGPRVGDPQKLDGQVFDIHPDLGDPDTWVAHHRQFSTAEVPPEVQSGEMLLMHESGNKVFFAKDKSLAITGQNGAVTMIDPNGQISHMPGKGQFVLSGGDPQKDTFAFVMTVNGPSTTHKAKIG